MATSTPQETFKRCSNCQNFIPELATICQYCGADQDGSSPKTGKKDKTKRKMGIGKMLLYGVLALFGCGILTVIGSQFSDNQSSPSNNTQGQVAALPTFTPTSVAPAQVDPATSTPVPVPTNTPIPSPTPQPIVLAGAGQQASPVFQLNPGLAIARLTHNGARHFGVNLLDSQGQLVDLLANDIGLFDGSKAVEIDSGGQFLLDISADGNWSVTITQPNPINPANPPLQLSGSGQQATDFFVLADGLHRFTLTHDGTRHFGVMLLDAQGHLIDLIANDIGPFNGSKAAGVRRSGAYLLNISADGNWTVSIE